MVKAFLAHSSNDKGYVRIIAEKLGPHKCIIDEHTFEEGMKTIEEIEKGLERTDIFVIFLSDSALKSKWINSELDSAYLLLNKREIKRIFPIIIDKNITYDDKRIPDWMRDEYNLKYISRPVVSSRRIIQKLREIVWNFNPIIKEREQIFVGRNELIKKYEERIDSPDDPTPICFVASGLNNIGRKSLIRNSYYKTNVFDTTYKPSIISLNWKESIEDFIRKLDDLGLSEPVELYDLLQKNVDEKVLIAVKIIKDIQKVKEKVFINDHGCIVTPFGKISNWFLTCNRDSIT